MANFAGRAEAWTRAQSSMLLKLLGDVVGSTGPASRPQRHLSARRAPIRLADGFSTRFTLQGYERRNAISGAFRWLLQSCARENAGLVDGLHPGSVRAGLP